ncbi:MAG: translation initiation factor [Thermoproteota archaeon]|nr:translation initiation factor [Thermoproteota archaeon]
MLIFLRKFSIYKLGHLMKKALRQPIVCVLGHVDAGKTSLLDKIRGSAVALREAGSMTQHIGASFFPLETLKEVCGPISARISGQIGITGLLVIDTPGHGAFMNLRRRGGSVADIAILVVDILRGFEAQTHESLSILKDRKTPFIVAANKVDNIPGWVKHSNSTFTESFNKQDSSVQRQLNDLLYSIMGTFSRLGFRADRFDLVNDFTKNVAIVPVSAKTGEGIPELLAILIGLTQQYMQTKLIVTEGPGKGTILEVKEESGLGMTINAILYDGILRRGDIIVIGGKNKPIVTRVKAILLPKPLDEMRDPRDKFTPVDMVSAAAGVKISAPEIEDAIAGAPLYVVEADKSPEELVKLVSDEIEKVRLVTDKVGVILKADTLGSLEAVINELENNGIPVRLADVGDISRREVIEASLIKKTAPLQGAILAFNVKTLPDAEEEIKAQGIPVFYDDIIYHLIDDYNEWVKKEKEAMIKKELEALVHPGKIRVLSGMVFRKSKPAVFGVEVLAGCIQPLWPMLTSDGRNIGDVIQIQDNGKSISEATIGMKVAVSMKEPIVGRHFSEGDILYVSVPEKDFKEFLTKYKNDLSSDDTQVLNELLEIMRKNNPFWGL